MNERIKLLAEQCRIETYGVNGELLAADFDEHKFAELIVRECADMAESFHRHQYDFTGNLELYEFIREHFGVEE